LFFGILMLSILLVGIGGCWFLNLHGRENYLYLISHSFTFSNSSFTLYPAIFILKIGFMLLILGQILRLVLLTLFYLYQKDLAFFGFGSIILIVLLISNSY